MADMVLDVEAVDKVDAGFSRVHQSIKAFGAGAMSTFAGIGAALAGFFAIDKIVDVFRSAIDAAGSLELANAKLSTQLRVTGNAAGWTLDQLGAMADQIQQTTRFSDDQARAAQSVVLAFKNVRGEQFRQAIKLSADLAEKMGTDLAGAAERVGEALQSPMDGLSMLEDSGVWFTEQERKVIEQMVQLGQVAEAQDQILQKLAGSVGGLAEAAGSTLQGRLDKLGNRMQDLYENVGNALIPAFDMLEPYLESAFQLIEKWAGTIPGWIESISAMGKAIWDSLQPAFQFLMDTGAMAFAAFDTAVEHWKDIAVLAFLHVELAVVKFVNEIQYQLTEVAPQYLEWLADNWLNIFMDMARMQATVTQNIGKNLFNFFQQIVSWLKGDGFDFKWTGLTEGFESSLSELPTIAARSKGIVEGVLEGQINTLTNKVTDTFADKMLAYQDVFSNMFTGLVGDTVAKHEDFVSNASKDYQKLGVDAAKAGGDTVGLEELSNKIASAAFGAKKDPTVTAIEKGNAKQTEVVNATKETKKVIEERIGETNRQLAEVNRNLSRGTPARAA